MFGLAMHYVLQALLFARSTLWPATSGCADDAKAAEPASDEPLVSGSQSPAPMRRKLSRTNSINTADAFASYHEKAQESAMLSSRGGGLSRPQSLPKEHGVAHA